MFRSCCMKLVCFGCMDVIEKQGAFGYETCPFCRSPAPETGTGVLETVMKRVDARDPEAIRHLGDLHLRGIHGLDKNESRAFELWTEAAELGSIKALSKMGAAYYFGRRGLSPDKSKGVRYLESAAMQGGVESRHLLGLGEMCDVKVDRAVRHYLIAAKMGYDKSLDSIKEMFAKGLATKQQYVDALKGYQDAVEEMKSPERDEAAATGYGPLARPTVPED